MCDIEDVVRKITPVFNKLKLLPVARNPLPVCKPCVFDYELSRILSITARHYIYFPYCFLKALLMSINYAQNQ